MELLAKADELLSGVYCDYLKLVKYLGIGIIATVADWVIFYLLIRYMGVFYLLALAVSYCASSILNFFMNKRFTFRNLYRKVHVQLASFFIIALIGLAINEVIMYGLVHYVFSSNGGSLMMASRVIATFVVFMWNYMINKRVTFKIFS